MADETAQLERENQDSVKISRTSKGEVSFEVKCYAKTADEAAERARATYDSLCVKFPKAAP